MSLSIKACVELYRRAAKAFRRIYGYPYRKGDAGDMRWLAGWQQGWLAAKRKYDK